MARRYHYRKSRSYRPRTVGRSRALEHIEEAKELSRELGGVDSDVKDYFFSLSNQELSPIFQEYEALHGTEARKYAEKTIQKWRSGHVHMSGMVAKRLFKLLPPRMPLEKKYHLTTNLWKHVGPSSKKTYYVSPNAEIDVIIDTVRSYLEQVVVEYKIPDEMKRRFDWLSQGDVEVKQELLNFLRKQERNLLTNTLKNQLDTLQSHLQETNGEVTHHIAQVLKVGKHEVTIVLDKRVEGITEKPPQSAPPYRPSASAKRNDLNSDNLNWLWWAIGGLLLLWLLGV